MTALTRICCDRFFRLTARRNHLKNVLIVKLPAVVLGVRVKIMMPLILQRSTSVLPQYVKCIKQGSGLIIIIGISFSDCLRLKAEKRNLRKINHKVRNCHVEVFSNITG